jgi:hypothetical protein
MLSASSAFGKAALLMFNHSCPERLREQHDFRLRAWQHVTISYKKVVK